MSNKHIPAGAEVNPQVPDDEALRQINAMVRRQKNLENEIAQLETNLDEAKSELKRVSQELIPDSLLGMGIQSLELVDGSTLVIDRFYAASIPKDPADKKKAFSWLRSNGHGGLIKTKVISTFGRGEQTEVKQVVGLLKKNHLPFEQKDEVHHQTLKAFVREVMEGGEQLPADLFGVFVGNRSIIKTK
jgi:hypothetical protein